MKTLASTFVLGTLVTVMAGCAANGVDETNAGVSNMTVGAAGAGSAKVETKMITSDTELCSVHIEWPVVTATNAEASAKIAEVLAADEPAVASICDSTDTETRYEQEGGFTVDLNTRNLLSISFGSSHFTSGMSSIGHHQFAHTFDLTTGAELKLADILTPAALDKTLADCVTEMGDELYCQGAIKPEEGQASYFSLREDGLAVLLRVPEEHFVPWTALPINSFKPGLVANWRATAFK